MNWAQFKDPASHMSLAGTVVESWFLTQEVAGLSPFSDNYVLSPNLLNLVKTFSKNFIGIHSSFSLTPSFGRTGKFVYFT